MGFTVGLRMTEWRDWMLKRKNSVSKSLNLLYAMEIVMRVWDRPGKVQAPATRRYGDSISLR